MKPNLLHHIKERRAIREKFLGKAGSPELAITTHPRCIRNLWAYHKIVAHVRIAEVHQKVVIELGH